MRLSPVLRSVLVKAVHDVYYTSDLFKAYAKALAEFTGCPRPVESVEVYVNKVGLIVYFEPDSGHSLAVEPKRKVRGGADWIADRKDTNSVVTIAGERFALDPCGSYAMDEAIILVIAAFMTHGAFGAIEQLGKALGRCCICGALLTDDMSKARGIGPECIKKIGVRHWYLEELAKRNVTT